MLHGLRWRWARLKAERQALKPTRLEATGDQFRRAVLDHYGVDSLDELDPTRRMWADFTLSSVDRGMAAVAMMGGEAAFQGKRVLDVGCAQGGFVIAASRAGAESVVGIDVNPKVFETAPRLMADYEVEADLRLANLTEPALPKELGTFDLILCNDVLEHVTDVGAAIANLDRLMAPQARIFLEIPNGNAVHYVRSDGHYKLPGITLLDFEDARAWHRAFYPDAGPYDTYFYGTLEFYLAAFSDRGIALRLLHVPPSDEIHGVLTEFELLSQEFTGFRERHSDKPADLVATILARVGSYQTQLQSQVDRYQSLDDPKERFLLGTTLRIGYEVGNWTLAGAKF